MYFITSLNILKYYSGYYYKFFKCAKFKIFYYFYKFIFLQVEQWRLEVARRLSNLEKLDGEPIIRTEENPIQLIKTDSPSHDLFDQEHG